MIIASANPADDRQASEYMQTSCMVMSPFALIPRPRAACRARRDLIDAVSRV